MADETAEHIKLPERLVSSADLARVVRELEALDSSLYQASLRKPGEPTKLARSSVVLEELASMNGVSLLDNDQRAQLLDLARALYEHAPRVRMSLATEPSGRFVRTVIVWLRGNIHSTLLLEIGMQPSLAAGCMLRTPNKVFDMSLRHRFKEQGGLLAEKLREVTADEQ